VIGFPVWQTFAGQGGVVLGCTPGRSSQIFGRRMLVLRTLVLHTRARGLSTGLKYLVRMRSSVRAAAFLECTSQSTAMSDDASILKGNARMKLKHFSAAVMALVLGCGMTNAFAQDAMKQDAMKKDPNVGGSPMYSNKNIVENAVKSKDHTTLVAAVKAAGLVDTLSSPGPFTVFAPTNEAFNALPAGTVDTLLKPENKDQLKKVLTYHVVAGTMDSKAIKKAIKDGNGKATLKTVEGGTLTAMMKGGKLVLTDEKGGMSTVTIADVYQSNGIIHVANAVLLPN
jgi:uncharacterized surface protein with fasciclin (FAS1) repeats